MSVVQISTANTMGVRRLMSGTQRSFRQSRPNLVGYHVTRGLGDANSFQAGMSLCEMQGTPCDEMDMGVYSVGTLASGEAGYAPLATYMPDAFSSLPQPAAPVTGTLPSPTAGGVPQTPMSFVPPQPAAPAGSAAGQASSTATSSGGMGFPLWVGIAILVAAAIVLPPLIKKL